MIKYLKLTLTIITGLLLSFGCDGRICSQGPYEWGHMMHFGFGYGGIFMWIIFLIVIGLLIYFIVQTQKTKDRTPTQNESPLDILKRRYAKGELTREEYEKMKKDLEV